MSEEVPTERMFAIDPAAINVRRYNNPGNVKSAWTVRVYRHSPERVMLQIRGDKQYASVTLPFDTASKIAAALSRSVPRRKIGARSTLR